MDVYVYFSTFIGAMAGLAYSSTIVGQLVFFEITGVCSWGLISYYMTPTAKKAGMKALIITHIGALGLYIGAAFLFAGTGTFALSAISQLDSGMKTVVLLLILCGMVLWVIAMPGGALLGIGNDTSSGEGEFLDEAVIDRMAHLGLKTLHNLKI